ncbi:FAF-like protein, chloroplastic [Tanacetum coccineum]
MAACGSLQHIFENPLDTPSPLTSCKHIIPMKPVNTLDSSSTDVFSGFNLNDKTDSFPSSPDHNSERLSEYLGCESFEDVEDVNDQWEQHEHITKHTKSGVLSVPKRSRISGKEIPPPISSIGRRVCFKSYRCNGRLILKEEKIPTQEILHAFREDGRLKLQFIQFDDDAEVEREKGQNVGQGNGVEVHQDCDDNNEKNEIREESP